MPTSAAPLPITNESWLFSMHFNAVLITEYIVHRSAESRRMHYDCNWMFCKRSLRDVWPHSGTILGRQWPIFWIRRAIARETGSSRVCNAQPVVLMTRLGAFALAHNGNLVNARELRDLVDDGQAEFTSTTDSELIAFAVQQAVDRGLDWPAAIEAALKLCKGAFSLVIGTPDGLFAVRDGHGIRPLVFGTLGDSAAGHWVVSSETCGLEIIGACYVDDVKPGELVRFELGSPDPQRRCWSEEPNRLCVFEMIYFARPDSQFFGESLYSYRQRIGRTLARESCVDADLVIGVPDSGIPAAIGFSQESGIPYGDGLIKNRYVGRTFIQPTQAMREAGIRVKLNPLPDVLAGKRLIVIDDSIVRGTTKIGRAHV